MQELAQFALGGKYRSSSCQAQFTWENKQTGNVSQYWKSILKGFGYYLEPALEMEAAIEAHSSK
jgi:hypothetical protein